jgi:hypothetical protein
VCGGGIRLAQARESILEAMIGIYSAKIIDVKSDITAGCGASPQQLYVRRVTRLILYTRKDVPSQPVVFLTYRRIVLSQEAEYVAALDV